METQDIKSVAANFDLLGVALSHTTLRRVGRYWIGPCPFCGGKDRMNIKQIGPLEYLWVCRKCAPGKYKDAIDFVMQLKHLSFSEALTQMTAGIYPHLSAAEQEARAIRSAAENAKRQAEIDARLADLTTHEIWEALHRRLDDDARAWWRSHGVPNDWQDYLSLGFTDDKPYYNHEQALCHSPAYTIPYFHYEAGGQNSRRFVTMQYRLVDAPDPNDRYRFEYGIGSAFYMVTPTEPLRDQVVVCEGAKKAIVTRVYGGLKDKSVVAVPSKSDDGGLVEKLKEVGRVLLVLDPDALFASISLAKRIGRNTLVVDLPFKIDDALLSGHFKKDWLHRYFSRAVRI